MAVIELQKICRTYQMGESQVHALKPTDLTIEEGQFVAIMGPSGSGKSTMLNLLGMLDRPTDGAYLLEGKDVASLADDRISEIRCSRIGFIFQSFNLFPGYTVLENVCVPMRYNEVLSEKEMTERATELLDLVGLGDRLEHRPTQLSGGQCQRVAIARSLANDPSFLLADEPTGNLDEKTGEEILALFRRLQQQGRTLVMVTHNPEYEDEVDRIVRLHDGVIREDRVVAS